MRGWAGGIIAIYSWGKGETYILLRQDHWLIHAGAHVHSHLAAAAGAAAEEEGSASRRHRGSGDRRRASEVGGGVGSREEEGLAAQGGGTEEDGKAEESARGHGFLYVYVAVLFYVRACVCKF